MDFLKAHLGEELFKQVSEKLKDSGLKLADLSKGEYVSKDKHTRNIAEKDDALKAKETELESLRANLSGDEKLKKQITSLTEELTSTKSELGRFKNEKAVLSAGIKTKYVNAAITKASRLVDKETTFEKALEKVSADFPEWKEEVKPKQNSSFPLNGGGGNPSDADAIKAAANAVLRKAK